MKKLIRRFILPCLFMISSTPVIFSKDLDIYDKNWNRTGHIKRDKDKAEIFDKDRNRTGFARRIAR